MRKISILVAATATLAFAVPTGMVQATPPAAVQFEVPTAIPSDGPTFGPFSAAGPAVDSGRMCPSGDTIDVYGKASGFQSGAGINFQVVKQFTCDDGSGDFFVKLQVRIDRKGDTFHWTIVGGTGAYENLHGTGSGVGLPDCGTDCVVDVYDGKLHID